MPYTPVETPNGETLKWERVGGVKVYRLVVEEIEWEIAPGMKVKAWGYNGRTPGPTIEAGSSSRTGPRSRHRSTGTDSSSPTA